MVLYLSFFFMLAECQLNGTLFQSRVCAFVYVLHLAAYTGVTQYLLCFSFGGSEMVGLAENIEIDCPTYLAFAKEMG